MSFSGTQQKCKECDKTVHFIDMLSADGVIYHKTCFRCSHCNGLLVVSNYSSMDGVLYCKAHFEQLFKETGNFSKKFSAGKPPERPNELGRTPSKLSAMFGTQDKCSVCKKTVYALEKVRNLTSKPLTRHKGCFRCSHGGCNLNPSSYAALDGILYCKPHFNQLFREKGSYTHLTKTASLKKNAAVTADETVEAESEAPADQEQGSEAEHTPQLVLVCVFFYSNTIRHPPTCIFAHKFSIHTLLLLLPLPTSHDFFLHTIGIMGIQKLLSSKFMILIVILAIFDVSGNCHSLTEASEASSVADFNSGSFWHSPDSVPLYEDEIDPIFGASRRAIPAGPNPLHN